MATARQTVQIIAQNLSLAEGRLIWAVDTIRAARLLPAAQGNPVHLSWREVAIVLLAAALGNPISNKPWQLSQWCEAADDTGTTLQQAIAFWLKNPEPLTRLTTSLTAPAATAIEEFDAVPKVRQFGAAEGLDRTVVIHGDTLRTIARDINNAPAVRAGRPTIKDKQYA